MQPLKKIDLQEYEDERSFDGIEYPRRSSVRDFFFANIVSQKDEILVQIFFLVFRKL